MQIREKAEEKLAELMKSENEMNDRKQRIRLAILTQLEGQLKDKQDQIEGTISEAEKPSDDKDKLALQLASLTPLSDQFEDMSVTLNKYQQYNVQWRPDSKHHGKVGKDVAALRKREQKARDKLRKKLDVSLLSIKRVF